MFVPAYPGGCAEVRRTCPAGIPAGSDATRVQTAPSPRVMLIVNTVITVKIIPISKVDPR